MKPLHLQILLHLISRSYIKLFSNIFLPVSHLYTLILLTIVIAIHFGHLSEVYDKEKIALVDGVFMLAI